MTFIQQTKYSKPSSCTGCSLAEAGIGFTVTRPAPVGSPLVVTDCVGSHDIRVGYPLNIQSESGSVLDRAFRLAGISPDSMALASLVACKPPSFLSKQPYEFTAIDHCINAHLAAYIREYRPRVILALGAIPARTLTGYNGEKQTIDLIRGYTLPGIGVAQGIPVIPAPSPGYIQAGNWHELSLLISDVAAAATSPGVLPDDSEIDEYMLHVGPKELMMALQMLKSNPGALCAYDFEFQPAAAAPGGKKPKFTTDANITQVNLTLYSGGVYATMVADWNVDNKDIIIEILQTDNIKVGFNSDGADEPVALYNGFDIRGRERHDVQKMFHFRYPDLPADRDYDEEEFLSSDDGGMMALQVAASLAGFPAPWKHLSGKDPHFYGARDSHATLVSFFHIADSLVAKQNYGTYDYFVRRYYDEILRVASDHGYPLSAKGLGDLQDFIKEQITAANGEIQAQVPPDLKPYKERKPRSDKELEALVAEHGENLFKASGIWSDDKCHCGEKSIGQPAPGCQDCHGTGIEIIGVKACPGCKKHSVIPGVAAPGSNLNGWTCEWCKWVDLRPVEFGRKDTKKSVKLAHDADLAGGVYACPTCKGAREVANEKPCACTKRVVYDPMCPDCKGAGIVRQKVDRWCIRQPFNPNSPDQLKRYATARGHTPPRSGFGRDGLAQLARQTGDPVYKTAHSIKVLEVISGAARPLSEVAGITESEVIRVHPQFMFTSGDGRVTTRNPDLGLRPPDHKYPGLAEKWKAITAAYPTPETMLVEVHFVNAELELFACEARDEAMLSIAPQANEWLTVTANLKTPMHPASSQVIWEAFMCDRGPKATFERNRHLFSGADSVDYLLKVIEFNFPRSVEYRRMQANTAHKQGYLRSRFGFERQFYNVLRQAAPGSSAAYQAGSDYHNAIAFMHKNHLACVQSIAAHCAPDKWQLVNVLDGVLVYEVPRDAVLDFPGGRSPSGVIKQPDGTDWTPRVEVRRIGAEAPPE